MANKRSRIRNLSLLALFLLLSLPAALVVHAVVVNRASKDMTLRQKILRSAYPLLTSLFKMSGRNVAVTAPPSPVTPPVAFHSLPPITMNGGEALAPSTLKGRRLLLVNTASDCGYTPQYAALQRLHEREGDGLLIIAFPANDFKRQEQGGDLQIGEFCRRNYGVTFPIANKSTVVKGPGQHPVFEWLSDPQRNGWNGKPPVWNFTKYLVDGQGRLAGCFEPTIDPLGPELGEALAQAL